MSKTPNLKEIMIEIPFYGNIYAGYFLKAKLFYN